MPFKTVPRLFLLLLVSSGFTVPVSTDGTGINVEQRTLFITRAPSKLCEEGEYYESSIDQCRSCSIPCKLNRKTCRDMGCGDYLKTKKPPVTIESEGQGYSTLATETNFTSTQECMFVGIVTGCITVVLLIGGLALILIRRARGKALLKDLKDCIKGTGHSQTKQLIGDEETGRKKEDDDIKSPARGGSRIDIHEESNHQVLSKGTRPMSDLGDAQG